MLQGCGGQAWPLLRPAWQTLLSAKTPSVQRALLAQFSPLANNLGRKVSVSELVPGLEEMVDQHLEAVAPALVQQLGSLMASLPAVHRQHLLHALPMLAKQSGGCCGFIDWEAVVLP